MRPLLPLALLVPFATAPVPVLYAAEGGGGVEAVDEERGFLGVVVADAPADPLDGQGLVVQRVVPFSTASELGLRGHDVLIQVGGRELKTREDLAAALADAAVGDPLTVVWTREGERMEQTAPLRTRPRPDEIRERIRETRREVERMREEAGETPEQDLAKTLERLSDVLEALPQQLQDAAKEFKAVYPDGEFTIDIDIRIRSTKDGAVIDLSPEVPDQDGEDAAGDDVGTDDGTEDGPDAVEPAAPEEAPAP